MRGLFGVLGLILALCSPAFGQATGVGANIAPAQVTVTGSATLVANSRGNRVAVTVENHGTTAMFCGQTSGVTTATGFRLPGVDGASLTLPYRGPLYCITSGGSQAISVIETY